MNTESLRRAFALAYGGRPEASLRPEEERKTRVLPGLLDELTRLLPKRPAVVVEAASGRAPVAIALAAHQRACTVYAIDRAPHVAAAAQRAFDRVRSDVSSLATRTADVADLAVWPVEPDLVVAVHACGAASDAVIDTSVRVRAKHVLVLPCCVSRELPSAQRADAAAARLHFDRGQARKRFRDVFVLNERRLVLEAAGWKTDVVPVCPESASPYNLCLRGVRAEEPVRARRAAEALAELRATSR